MRKGEMHAGGLANLGARYEGRGGAPSEGRGAAQRGRTSLEHDGGGGNSEEGGGRGGLGGGPVDDGGRARNFFDTTALVNTNLVVEADKFAGDFRA